MHFCKTMDYEINEVYNMALQVLSEGTYSTEPLHWSLDEPYKSQCRLRIELQPGAFPGFLRPCGKVNARGRNLLLIENCPADWTDRDIAKKCNAYAFYSMWNSSVSNSKYRCMTAFDIATN
jgi:hypothetical protein